MISDRICIIYDQMINFNISSWNLITCCETCGSQCYGGDPFKALQYWVTTGIVTGGDYNDTLSCQPYPFPKCSHTIQSKYPECPQTLIPPMCLNICLPSYKIRYPDDKYYGIQIN